MALEGWGGEVTEGKTPSACVPVEHSEAFIYFCPEPKSSRLCRCTGSAWTFAICVVAATQR